MNSKAFKLLLATAALVAVIVAVQSQSQYSFTGKYELAHRGVLGINGMRKYMNECLSPATTNKTIQELKKIRKVEICIRNHEADRWEVQMKTNDGNLDRKFKFTSGRSFSGKVVDGREKQSTIYVYRPNGTAKRIFGYNGNSKTITYITLTGYGFDAWMTCQVGPFKNETFGTTVRFNRVVQY